MKSKRRQKVEYEVCTLDADGDIQDIEFFDGLDKKTLAYYEGTARPKQLWRVVWSFTEFEDGQTDDPSRDTETLVSEEL